MGAITSSFVRALRCCVALAFFVVAPAAHAAPSTPTGADPGSTSSPGPTLSSRTVTLGWNGVSGATYYDLGVRDMDTNALVRDTTTGSTHYTTTLDPSGRYRWNVAACSSSGCSSYTTPRYFRTPGSSPSTPGTPSGADPGSTSSPGPTLGSRTVTLGWNGVSGASYYDVGVRDMDTNTLVLDTTTGSTHYTTTLNASGRYRWNVAACNSSGCSSYTTPRYFRTPGSTPSTPSTPGGTDPGSASSPGPALGSTTVTLSWNGVSGASYYDVGVRDMDTNSLVLDTTTGSTHYTTTLNASGRYRWNVAACNSAGCSSYSTPLYFRTPGGSSSTPSVPSGGDPGSSSSPGPMLGSATVTLSWTGVSGASYYDVGVRDMDTNTLVLDTTTGSTHYTTTLNAAGGYRWNVAACNSAGCSSFTAPLYFQTPGGSSSTPGVPSGGDPGSTSSPGPTLGSTTVSLSWTGVSGASYYDLGVRDMISDTLVLDTTAGSTGYTVTLDAARRYRWNVAACNSSGCSAFTTPLYFQTPAETPATPSMPGGSEPGSASSPGPMLGNRTVTLRWSGVSGATHYDLGVRDIDSNTLVFDTTTGSTEFTTILDDSKRYRWNVAACNSSGCSSFTTPLYFQTPAPPPQTDPALSVSPPSVRIGHSETPTSFRVADLTNGLPTNPGTSKQGSGALRYSAIVAGTPWITIVSGGVGYAGGIIAVKIAENFGEERSGKIVVTADGANPSTQTITVNQKAATAVGEYSAGMRVMSIPDDGNDDNGVTFEHSVYKYDAVNDEFSTLTHVRAGVHGEIVNSTPVERSKMILWQVRWDSLAPNFRNELSWISESDIMPAPAETDMDIPQPPLEPPFVSKFYTSDNIYYKAGFAPISDGWSMRNPGSDGNCTWYAYGRLLELGYDQAALNRISGGGDALAWGRNVPRLIDGEPPKDANEWLNETPVEGNIAWVEHPENYHVAVVEYVDEDKRQVTVTESSYLKGGSRDSHANFLWRRRTAPWTAFRGYIHVPYDDAKFSVVSHGAMSSKVVEVSVQPGDDVQAGNLQVFVAAEFNKKRYFLTATGWVPWSGGAMPAYKAGVSSEQIVSVLKGEMDVSWLVGTKLYVGYGTSGHEMFARGRFSHVYVLH